jgi:hypothetical protein
MVALCGAAPGLKVDFAGFNFQVPLNASEVCAEDRIIVVLLM